MGTGVNPVEDKIKPSPTDLKSPDFVFSQGSLQAYADCPRLFQLRYLQRVPWPAPEVEPNLENERTLRLGSVFHKLVQQFLIGIPAERLEGISNQDPQLSKWWTNFIRHHPELESRAKHFEITLSTHLDDYRLLAKYDLILQQEEKILIYDWKTNRKLIQPRWLAPKLQSRVYPFVLVKAGADLFNGMMIDPERVDMVYWFSNHPTTPVRLPYSNRQYQEDVGD